MANWNKVELMGNLTRDPELRHVNGNTSVLELGIAVNREWFDRSSDEKKKETTFIDCVAYAKQAETLAKYLSKGSPLFISGRLKNDEWTDKETGKMRRKTRVVIEQFQFIDSQRREERGMYGESMYPGSPKTASITSEQTDDDVPF